MTFGAERWREYRSPLLLNVLKDGVSTVLLVNVFENRREYRTPLVINVFEN